jgi:hypothetical protein
MSKIFLIFALRAAGGVRLIGVFSWLLTLG